MTQNFTLELEVALDAARTATANILPYYYGGVDRELKDDGTPVTIADKLANRLIVERITASFPADGIVSEEMATLSGRRTWYVDPIDGTNGFLSHDDHFAIHIGLADIDALFGLVYKPTTGEYYYGGKAIGAYRVNPDGSKKKLTTSPQEELILVANDTLLREQSDLLRKIAPSKIRTSGGQGLRMMQIAEGTGTLHLKYRARSGGTWDICAPQAIVEGAGGCVTYADGSSVRYHGQRNLEEQIIIVAAHARLNEHAQDLLREYGTEKIK
ncbi:3'(2'),5'-bisphosphate nucleotidase CysQ [Candidatus Woesearchaeota archaeon]|nr:3'(2'),5'-bisphosphate nucleotidase CysQ [Candidatus Woesearchaeota archaeon]